MHLEINALYTINVLYLVNAFSVQLHDLGELIPPNPSETGTTYNVLTQAMKREVIIR